MKILKSSEKKGILNKLNEQYGISKIPYLILKFGKEKLRIYSGTLPPNELKKLDNFIRIENAGIYFAKQEGEKIRLTLDGIQSFKDQITKNILEINDQQAKEWLKGNELYINTDKNFKIIKNNEEFIGCGKSNGERITNFVPKNRRVKN